MEGDRIVLPGFTSAHSHAFQRALRGRTQQPVERDSGSFWSWRELMYRLAAAMNPEQMYALSHFAFVELACAGVTTVGEFHYVHHQPDGTPYDDRLELSDAVIRAALDAGIRICLLRVIYERAGWGRAAEGAQRRFVDRDIDEALGDIDELAARYRHEARVSIGVAPHSVRAVSADGIETAARFARERALPFHMHLSEQPREVEECVAEHRVRGAVMLAERNVIDERFVAVHATHLDDEEIALLGQAEALVCLCRTTERDLGDGMPRVRELTEAGVEICCGVDSHASSDPFEEARAIELDERTRTMKRALFDPSALLRAGTENGARATGTAERASADRIVLCAERPELAGVDPSQLDASVLFGAHPASVTEVDVAERRIVTGGTHPALSRARAAFEQTLTKLANRPVQ